MISQKSRKPKRLFDKKMERRIKKIFEAGNIAAQARWIYVMLAALVSLIVKFSGITQITSLSLYFVFFLSLSVFNNGFWYFFRKIYFRINDRNAKIMHRVVFFQYMVDLFAITAIVHVAGGIESIFFIFYFFVIIASIFVYGRKEMFTLALLAIFFYDSLIFMEYFGLIATYPRYRFSNIEIHHSFEIAVINVFTVSTVLFASAVFVGYLSREKENQEKELMWEKDRRLREIKRTEEIRSRFVTVMTHELRTPLTHIKLALSSLAESGDKSIEEKGKLLRNASFSLEEILEMIDELVKIKDLETGRDILKKEKVLFSDILAEAVSELSSLAAQKEIKISFEKNESSKSLAVLGDRNLLLTAVKIFLENAIVYGNEKTDINISLSEKEGFGEIAVRNFGQGISAKDRQRIFLPFFRTEAALKTETDRTGLGLYLVKIIARKHKGRVFFKSVPKKETVFFLALPVAKNS
jgi:signal transduction histidine kinase